MRMMVAVAIAFGVQATASAQLGGLLKRGKKIATEGLPQYQDGEVKEAFIFRQLQFFMDRGQEFSDPEARAFFLDEVYSTLKIRTMETAKLHLNGNESGLSKVLSYLQSNRATVPEQYKWRYPETFTFAAAKEQYNTPDYSTKRIAQLRAYKELEAQGKSISTSHTAMMWQTEPARTKKWNTVCMYFFLLML